MKRVLVDIDLPPLSPHNAPMKKESFNANLDPDMLEWLRQEAVRRRCSMNQVLRDLLLAAMQNLTGVNGGRS